jgi:TatD DNase family protein
MKFIDAHIHLSANHYSKNINDIINEAKKSKIIGLLSNSVDLLTSQRSLHLADRFPNYVFAAIGIHPWNTKFLHSNEIQNVIDLLLKYESNRERLVAIGEIGLDSSYSGSGKPTDIQIDVFKQMLALAEKKSMPVVVHSRGAAPQIVNLLASYNINNILLHWFSGPLSLVPTIIDRGYYISEGPALLFSKEIQELIQNIPLKYLMTETDGPVHFRKLFKDKMTTPSCIPNIVQSIADLKNKKIIDVSNQIFNNFIDFFNLKGVRDKRNDV